MKLKYLIILMIGFIWWYCNGDDACLPAQVQYSVASDVDEAVDLPIATVCRKGTPRVWYSNPVKLFDWRMGNNYTNPYDDYPMYWWR